MSLAIGVVLEYGERHGCQPALAGRVKQRAFNLNRFFRAKVRACRELKSRKSTRSKFW